MKETKLTEQNIATENIFYDLYNFIEEKVTSVISFALNPFLNVQIKGKYVYINNIPTTSIVSDIQIIYGSYVSKHMFKEINSNTLVIHQYFLPELLFVLKEMLVHVPDDTIKKPKKMTASNYTTRRIIEKLYENTWLSNLTREHVPILDRKAISKNLLWDPLPHQEDFLDYYDKFIPRYKLRGALFAGAPGAGKTISSLFVAEGRHSELVIIVSPKNAIDEVWRETIDEQYSTPQPKWVIGDSKDMKRVKNLRFIIINYDMIGKYIKDIKKVAKGKKTLVILDESHNFNTITSKRTSLFLDLVDSILPADVLLLSGTPIKAIAAEALPLLKSVIVDLDDEVIDIAKKIYRSHNVIKHRLGLVSYTVEKKELKLDKPISHHITVDFPEKEDYTLEKVKEAMSKYSEERGKFYAKTTKKDYDEFFAILKAYEKTLGSREDLQEYDGYVKTVKILIAASLYEYRELSEHMRLVNIYETSFIIPTLKDSLVTRFKAIRSQVKYVELKIQGEVLGRIVTKMRIECHTKMAEALDIGKVVETSEKKTMIFSSNVAILNAAMKNVVSAGYNPVGVYGSEVKNLNKNVRLFHENEHINPLLASYPALSTAVPITVASSVIILDYPFRDYILSQSISRVHRLGQDTQVHVYYLNLDTDSPNIADRSRDIVTWSQQEVAKITGVESPVMIGDAKGFDSSLGYEPKSITDKIVANFIMNVSSSKSSIDKW